MRRLLPLLVLFAAGCKKDPAGNGKIGGVPTFEEIEHVVTVGDNVGSNPSFSRSYIALLSENDDEIFPMFAGADFTSALPKLEQITRLDRGGDSYYALAETGDALRIESGNQATLIIVELGVNDLIATALAMLSDTSMQADPQPAIDTFQADVAAVLADVTDPEVLGREPLVVVTNIVDPSDGVGDLADLVTSFFPFEGAENVTPELALEVIDGFNGAIETEAAAIGAEVIDIRGAFLGHGYHYDDTASPNHDAADETFWYSTVIDPNLRGAHEIRRETWLVLTGDDISEIPTDLPVESISGLPDVPDEGWANAVVESAVTLELVDDSDVIFTNIAADPEDMVGPPTGSISDITAIGVTGAYVIVDLGEGEAATDGADDDLVVLEYGAQSGGTPEPYRVSVATDPAGPWTVLGDASGERAFDLADAGISSARYIRVESQAQSAEVLGGLGSPYYPGPEIDAVGAVYPGP